MVPVTVHWSTESPSRTIRSIRSRAFAYLARKTSGMLMQVMLSLQLIRPTAKHAAICLDGYVLRRHGGQAIVRDVRDCAREP